MSVSSAAGKVRSTKLAKRSLAVSEN